MTASTGTTDRTFEAAVAFVLRLEGGQVHRPDDPGGLTKFGIAARHHPDVDVAALTRAGAIDIYRDHYWDRYRYDRVPIPAIAVHLFSACVNLGPDDAGRILQRAINQVREPLWPVVVEDGIVGPVTVEAMGGLWGHRRDLLLNAFIAHLVERYFDRGYDAMFKGLIRRAVAVPTELHAAMTSPSPPTKSKDTGQHGGPPLSGPHGEGGGPPAPDGESRDRSVETPADGGARGAAKLGRVMT